MSSRHYLYFFTDVNDTVIYVGITNNMESRINQHFGRSGHLEAKAYEEVVTIHHAEFPCKNEAVIYETYYISKLQPEFNTMMKNDGLVGFDLPSPEIKKTITLDLIQQKETVCKTFTEQYNLVFVRCG